MPKHKYHRIKIWNNESLNILFNSVFIQLPNTTSKYLFLSKYLFSFVVIQHPSICSSLRICFHLLLKHEIKKKKLLQRFTSHNMVLNDGWGTWALVAKIMFIFTAWPPKTVLCYCYVLLVLYIQLHLACFWNWVWLLTVIPIQSPGLLSPKAPLEDRIRLTDSIL